MVPSTALWLEEQLHMYYPTYNVSCTDSTKPNSAFCFENSLMSHSGGLATSFCTEHLIARIRDFDQRRQSKSCLQPNASIYKCIIAKEAAIKCIRENGPWLAVKNQQKAVAIALVSAGGAALIDASISTIDLSARLKDTLVGLDLLDCTGKSKLLHCRL